jgi:hypothetical protein
VTAPRRTFLGAAQRTGPPTSSSHEVSPDA